MDILRGMIIGYEDDRALVEHNDELVIIYESEIGGEYRKGKIQKFLGASINFVILGEENGLKIGSRKKAMEILQEEYKNLKVDEQVNIDILTILQKVIVADCRGHEVYIPVEECVPYRMEDLRDSDAFNVGDEIAAVVINTSPLKVSIKQVGTRGKWDSTHCKIKSQYCGNVVSKQEMGVFVKIPVIDVPVLCRHVNWRKNLDVGDRVVIQIEDISEEKRYVWGHIIRFIKKV
ncbi:hypothetical protein HZI73_26150 (plasmid) [Vallitalea pronyensis]|uniref:S1 motif domain-containing protein n=1 Tax=Vallitalea pronyensis TaxID=1348613 RepID=A0A8J8MQR0_9FIRM|nr:hypothetical protein [Vallitalea pronyensis]QUI25897.1 hypothetical protein HZI73_26150 [Vallitalea pronyensis]